MCFAKVGTATGWKLPGQCSQRSHKDAEKTNAKAKSQHTEVAESTESAVGNLLGPCAFAKLGAAGGSELPGQCSPRSHKDTEKTNAKAKPEHTEVAEVTERRSGAVGNYSQRAFGRAG